MFGFGKADTGKNVNVELLVYWDKEVIYLYKCSNGELKGCPFYSRYKETQNWSSKYTMDGHHTWTWYLELDKHDHHLKETVIKRKLVPTENIQLHINK